MKVKKGDTVKIIRGKDKGKTGTVEKVFPVIGKVVVTGMNQYKRHVKGKGDGKPSEITILTKPMPVTNTQIICPKCHLPTRIGFQMQQDKKIRICKKCEQAL